MDLEFSGFWFLFSEIPKFDLDFIGILSELSGQTEFPELADCPNFHTIMAPVYIPFDLPVTPEFHVHDPLRLGFFGQYRREKNLDFFLQAFVKANFTTPVTLTVLGATATQVDSDDFERLGNEYANDKNIRFCNILYIVIK